MNMDTVLRIMREMQDEWAATKTEWASYKDFIDNYFANLNVNDEVLNAMRIFASDGTLNEILDPKIAETTTEWLTTHITPTTPPVDNSLTISGAAADAFVTGLRISRCLGQNNITVTADNIKDYNNLDEYPINSNIIVDSSAVSLIENYPLNTSGIVITLNGYNSFNGAIQFCYSYDGVIKYRTNLSNTWSEFRNFPFICNTTVTSNNINNFNNPDDYAINTYIIVPTSVASQINNSPFSTGYIILTVNGYYSKSGTIQIAYSFDGDLAIRNNVSNSWNTWHKFEREIKNTVITIGSKGDYKTFTDAMLYLMSIYMSCNYYNRYTVELDAETYDISNDVNEIIATQIKGLFVPPYCTIKGKGKDKTIIKLENINTTDEVMSNISALNIGYQATIEDLTITVKNVRYAVHADGSVRSDENNFINGKVNYNTVNFNNVKLIHNGFDTGLNPTYRVPAAYGGGLWNATDRIFMNCDFIASNVSAFLIHDRPGLTAASEIKFENCKFINFNPDVRIIARTDLASCTFISWGSNLKCNVTMNNCAVNKYVAMTVVTNYNPDAVIDYYINANNKLFIIEDTINDSQLTNNFFSDNCEVSICSSSNGIIAYKPISKNRLYWVKNYNNADAIHGIALNSASLNEQCVIQTSGYVSMALLTNNTFTDGDNIGYNGSEWVVDNDNPIIKYVGGNLGIILPVDK